MKQEESSKLMRAIRGGLGLHWVERMVTKAFQKPTQTGPTEMGPTPLSEKQYCAYLDLEGRIKSLHDLRISIYYRGVEPSLRRAVWKHLLNVYPPDLTGQQRYEYIKHKAEVYQTLKTVWQSHLNHPLVESTLNMVRKDVLRTDRTHPFYSGDDNPNVISSLNILTTFALNHGVKYCQGMSDLASPLLYAMKDEAQAYICFCALMLRLRENFSTDGEAITRKFEQLGLLLQYYDPDFYAYLKQSGAQDLLFCYRWILLELKREFAFDDALHMLEVLWSSIPPLNVDDLPLYEEEYKFIPEAMRNFINCPQSSGKVGSDDDLPDHFESLSLSSSLTASHRKLSDHHHHHHTHHHRIKTSDQIPIRGIYDHFTGPFRALNHSLPEYNSKIFDYNLGRITPAKLKTVFNTLGESAPAPVSSSYLVKARHHLRTIRFLPKILSNDSYEIDSPEAEDYNKQFSFPPKMIDKGSSLDEDDVRRMSSFESVDYNRQSFEGENVEVISCQRGGNKISDAKERRQKMLKHSDAGQGTDLIVHCNGEFDNSSSLEDVQDWVIPHGLARSVSYEYLQNLTSMDEESPESRHSSFQYLEKERSEGYVSGADPSDLPSEVLSSNCALASSQSSSSSCSSLVILNSNGSIVDLTCTSRLKISLPSPSQLGSDTAFMLFLCLTLLLQHRDKTMSSKLDANEIAVYFDSYVRRHNVYSALESGRHLFHCYLSQWHLSLEEIITNRLPVNNHHNTNSNQAISEGIQGKAASTS